MEQNKNFEFAVIFINYNTENDILALIKTMRSFPTRFLFLVYDNKNDRHFEQQLAALSEEDIRYYADETNSGYCSAVNFCYSKLLELPYDIPYIGLLNSDIEFGEDVFPACRDYLSNHSDFIAVNPLVYDGSGRIWYSGGFFDRKRLTVNSNLPAGVSGDNCDFYNGCFVVFTRRILEFKLDDRLFMYYDEFDVSHRIRQRGYKIKLNQDISIVHHVSKSLSGMNHLKVYYKTRNYLYILKKYNYQGRLTVYKLFFRSGLSFLKHREYKSIRYMLKGIRDYRKGRMNKITD